LSTTFLIRPIFERLILNWQTQQRAFGMTVCLMITSLQIYRRTAEEIILKSVNIYRIL